MAYETDPDVAVFLTKGSSSKTIEPTMEQLREAQKKKKLTDANPQIQPSEETNYATDPDVAAFTTVTPQKSTSQTNIPSQLNQAVGNVLQKAFEAKQSIAPNVVSAIDTLTGLPNFIGYGVGRAFGLTPEEAQKASSKVPQAISQPLGRLTGLAQTEAYQKTIPVAIQNYIGEHLNESAQSIASRFNIPVEDAQAMLEAGLITAGLGAGKAYRGAKTVVKNIGEALPKVTVERVPNLQSGGAAAAIPENVLRGNIDAALASASPELQAHIQSKSPQLVNVPALETKALEEKHGVNLTTGQRTGDTQLYSQEWNKRGETETLGNHFNEQPVQIANAFETIKQRHAPDIPSTADASELGQIQINALAAKDAIRQEAISKAYKALEDANGGQFPIDVGRLDASINAELARTLKTNHLSDSIRADLKDFYANPTFEAYESLRTNLSNEMRSSSNGNARGAAYVVRQELEKLPVFGEQGGNPQAIQLKALADNARKLYAERQAIIKSNPAYKAAVKEAASLEEAASEGESLNAAKFHNKYVASATPEAIRRLKAEIATDDLANQAIAFSELDRAKNAAVNASGRNLTPEQFAKFYKQNKSVLRESLSPNAMQDVTELGMLTSKIGMPKTGTFNYSNTYSGMLSDMAKQGLLSLGEAKLAGMTGGASIPAVGLTRQWMQKLNKEGFAKEATNPFGGLTKD